MRAEPTPEPGDLARAPFSNGTTWDIFAANVCGGVCIHDSTYGAADPADWGEEQHCPLITLALLGTTPHEWLHKADPIYGPSSCTEFTEEQPVVPEPTPVSVDLFGVYNHEPRVV